MSWAQSSDPDDEDSESVRESVEREKTPLEELLDATARWDGLAQQEDRDARAGREELDSLRQRVESSRDLRDALQLDVDAEEAELEELRKQIEAKQRDATANLAAAQRVQEVLENYMAWAEESLAPKFEGFTQNPVMEKIATAREHLSNDPPDLDLALRSVWGGTSEYVGFSSRCEKVSQEIEIDGRAHVLDGIRVGASYVAVLLPDGNRAFVRMIEETTWTEVEDPRSLNGLKLALEVLSRKRAAVRTFIPFDTSSLQTAPARFGGGS